MSYLPQTPSTPGYLVSAASTNLTVIKSGPGVLSYLCVGNVSSAPVFAKLYDSVSATVGSTTPVQVFLIPGNLNGAGNNLVPPNGINFLNGISLALTGGIADNDATPISAAQTLASWGYL